MSELDYVREYRSGIEWNVAYAQDGAATVPIAGYVQGKDGEAPLVEVQHVEGAGLSFGEFAVIEGDERTDGFKTFDEALDAVNQYIYRKPEQDMSQYPVHDLTGNEGVYRLGEADGREYIANAFWSDEEPGYVNFGLYALQGDQMEVLNSGFYNGYLSIEDCVRDLAQDDASLDSPSIQFAAYCNNEFETIEDYREALEHGSMGKVVEVPSWSQMADRNANIDVPNFMEKLLGEKPETYYFSFGTADFLPYTHGWVEVNAKDRMEACEMYSSHFPKRDGLINCSFVYNAEEWQKAGLAGEPGQVCHQVIDSWGPHVKATEKSIDYLMEEARQKAAGKNAERPEAGKDHKPPELG